MKKLIITLFVFLISFNVGFSTDWLIEQPMAYYVLTANYSDSSGNAYHATNSGTSINANGVTYNGSDYIITGIPINEYIEGKTFSFWANSTDTAIYNFLGDFDGSANKAFNIKANYPSSTSRLTAYFVSANNVDWIKYVNTSVHNDGLWHFYTLVVGDISNNEVYFYIEGVLQTWNTFQITGSVDNYQLTDNIDLGQRGDNTEYFEGIMKEFVVFNSTLSSSQVLELYNNGGNPIAEETNVLFNDTFDRPNNSTVDGNISGGTWGEKLDTCGYQILNNHLYSPPCDTTDEAELNLTLVNTSAITIIYDYKLIRSLGTGINVKFFDSNQNQNVQTNTSIQYSVLNNEGTFIIKNISEGLDIINLTSNEWYNFKFILNFSSKTFAMYINNDLYYNDLGFKNSTVEKFTYLSFYSVSLVDNLTEYYLDNFTVFNTAVLPPVYVNSCTPPAININWIINMTDLCNITTNVELGTGNISFVGVSGNTTFNAIINISKLGIPPLNTTLYIIDKKVNIRGT